MNGHDQQHIKTDPPTQDAADFGYKLYPLTVRDAAKARLIEIINNPDFQAALEAEDDDAAPVVQLGFWVLLAAPFVALFLLGLFGGGL